MARNSEIAHELAATASQVTRWRQKGMPGELEAARSWHSAHVRPRAKRRKPAAGNGAEGLSWVERRARADALLFELRLAEASGRLLDRTAVLQGWVKHMGVFRARLLAIVNHAVARTRPETPRDVVLGIVQEEILDAMVELSGNGQDRDA